MENSKEYLREELRQTALAAFNEDVIDGPSLKWHLKQSEKEDALQPQPMFTDRRSTIEHRLQDLKEKIAKARAMRSQPGYEQHAKFIFTPYGRPFDVRPILELLQFRGELGIISALDTVMFNYMYHLNDDAFCDDTKGNFYMMRCLRDAFMRATNQIELDSAYEDSTEEEKEQQKLRFNKSYFEYSA